ncbi:hypothetical protein N7523_010404 [Penicillium sp. IBT 18751x]|nr:hypothetical protein N7523_010404 [Penicillium sp. IBT 18751x]
MTTTSMTFADDEASRHMVQSTLPQLGFKFTYVLRLLLAFSGYHIAHLKRKQQQQREQELLSSVESPKLPLITQADYHYTIALSKISAAIPTLNETNCHAVYTSAVFICFCSFGKGPQPGQYLGFSDDGTAEWLNLLAGVRSIVQYSRDALSVNPILSENSIASLHQHLCEPFENQEYVHTGWRSCLTQLQELLLENFSISDPRYQVYLEALDGLAMSFEKVYDRKDISRGDKWAQSFRWLYALPEVFVSDLQERQSLALLLFSPFVVLLRELDSYWFVCGWPEHIVGGIYRHLNVEQRKWIQWQMNQVGWKPPVKFD